MNYLVGRHRCAYGNKRFFLRRVLIAGMTLLPLLLCGIAMAENFTPPPVPEIPPVISDMYPEDADGNLVSDVLEDRMRTAESTSTSAPGLMLRATASMALDQMTDVELIFGTQVTQEQIDTFLAMGGEITYMYRSLSYGWNGRIALKEVSSLPWMLGGSLVLVQEATPTVLHLDMATRTGRVRPAWVSGFAGSASGFSGNANITIAILDTGVDGSHTDLSGRQQFWADYTGEGSATAVDYGGHGSHVSGIALGTGAAAGSATGTLYVTDKGDLTGAASGSSSRPCIRSPTVRSMAPSLPPGWKVRKCSAVKPRRSSRATARV